jgi:hypothetical protein
MKRLALTRRAAAFASFAAPADEDAADALADETSMRPFARLCAAPPRPTTMAGVIAGRDSPAWAHRNLAAGEANEAVLTACLDHPRTQRVD